MNAQGREEKDMKDKPVILEMCEVKPNYQKTAGMLLTDCRKFFEKPENEAAFQAWKAGKKCKKMAV